MRGVLRILLLLVAAVAVVGVYYSVRPSAGPEANPGKPVTVVIPDGANAAEIAELLSDERVLTGTTMFRLLVRYEGVASELRSGTYELKTAMSPRAAISALLAGPPVETFRLTIPEGLTRAQAAERVEGKGRLDTGEFERLTASAGNFSGHPFLPADGASLEGYLFPKTYELETGATSRELIEKMLDQFAKETSELDWSAADKLGLTPQEIIVVASLIERESKLDKERPLVASVVYNRLRINMALQIDATVQYALTEWKPRLTYEDLEVESPYNTYKQTGLPPGPIASPGIESIKAALNPADTEFLYYVLVDENGRHAFARTHEEFLRAKRSAKP